MIQNKRANLETVTAETTKTASVQKPTIAYLQTPTNIFGLASVTTISKEKTPELRLSESNVGLIVSMANKCMLIPWPNVKNVVYG